jgi:GNAT superfamily N-acetyltransferase
MEVRRATARDAGPIATVHVRTWQEAYPGLIPQDYLDALSIDERTTSWASTLADTDWPRRGTFVLEDAGYVVGFVFVRRSEDEDLGGGPVGEVVALYVRASAWGGGGGRALLEAARSEFTRAGYEYATLWVLGTNDRARRFYERCGWEADGATKLHDWVAFTAEDVRYRAKLDAG